MILFVGDKLNPKTGSNIPFKGAGCEKRLNEWIDFLTLEDVSLHKWTVYNHILLNSYSNDDQKNIVNVISAYREANIVALGNAAHSRLKKLGYESFKLPHPSGRNRQINDKEFIEQKLAECIEWLKARS